MKVNPVSWLSSILVRGLVTVAIFRWVKFWVNHWGLDTSYSSFGCCGLNFKETWPGSQTLKLRTGADGPQSSCYIFNQP